MAGKRKNTNLTVQLSYDTAASLHHLILAQAEHARSTKNDVLIEASKNLESLSNHIASYLE